MLKKCLEQKLIHTSLAFPGLFPISVQKLLDYFFSLTLEIEA